MGIYAHVPFCSRRCTYCDFFVVTGAAPEAERRLARALERDLEISAAGRLDGGAAGGAQALEGAPVDTFYFGGGTPARLAAEDVGRVLARARRLFDWREPAEVTLEANPESLDEPRLAALREAGVGRLSLGAQTLDEEALRALGRLHGESEVHASARAARRCGFEDLNFDLICGLPGLDPERFGQGLVRLLEHAPEHVSIYLLDMDTETPRRRAVEAGRAGLPPEDLTVETFAAAAQILQRAGYERYEVSNFALPGRRSRHNLKYWTDAPFLGIGPSAWSYLGGRRVRRVADLGRYLDGIEGGQAPCEPVEKDDPRRRLAEAVVMGLRLREGVDLEACGRAHGADALALYGERVRRLQSEGWLESAGGRVRLTPAALPVANSIWAEFIE